ncbi:hypothetical protein EAQG_04470 [Escherichia coli TA464]|nr:hypothetical protein EAQG_04470 [Escherichia coli TA464]
MRGPSMGCDGEVHHEVSRCHLNALKTHPGAILVLCFASLSDRAQRVLSVRTIKELW